MPAVYTTPGAYNTFQPVHDATNGITVNFMRRPNSFALGRYIQVVPHDKNMGVYKRFKVEEAGRVSLDGAEYRWPDGANAPEGTGRLEEFTDILYTTDRYSYSFNIGNMAASQATWNVVYQHAAIKVQQAMTFRTVKAISAFTTEANHLSSHILDVTADTLGTTGGWASSTTARATIKKWVNYAQEKIMLDTLGAVDGQDFILVISPALARAIAASQEIMDYIKGSPDAAAQVRGDIPNFNQYFGLPAKLYGCELVIEKTVRVSTPPGASTVGQNFVLPASTPFLCSRPGGLDGNYGTPTFSSGCLFVHSYSGPTTGSAEGVQGGDLTVEIKDDVDNRRTLGRVVDDFTVELVAPAATVLFKNANL